MTMEEPSDPPLKMVPESEAARKYAQGYALGKAQKGNTWAQSLAAFKKLWDNSLDAWQIGYAQTYLWKKGFEEDVPWAAKLWMEYTFGKPRQSLDVSTTGNQPVAWAIVPAATPAQSPADVNPVSGEAR